MKPHATLSTTSPYRRGQVISIDTGADAELVKVTGCLGAYPYTVTFRHYRWFDRTWDRSRAYVRRAWRFATRPVRDWRLSRCEARWCPRRATLETAEYDEYCDRHAPADARVLERWDSDDA